MSWVKRSDNFSADPGLIAAGRDAYVVHSCALEWVMSLDNQTAGRVPERVARTLGAAYVDDVPTAISTLVENGVWARAEAGYLIVHGMADQRSNSSVIRERELTRIRNENFRERNLTKRERAAQERATNGVSDGVTNGVTNASQPSPAQPSPKTKSKGAGRVALTAGADGPPPPSEPNNTNTDGGAIHAVSFGYRKR